MNALAIQRAADRQALNRNAVLAEQQRGYGVLQEEPSVMSRLGADAKNAFMGKADLFNTNSVMNPNYGYLNPEVGSEALMNMMPMGGITAFHGSPHLFNKFDMSKIGTGEGAQAYGHGLYMAENPNVAREYRDRLSGGIESIGGEPLNLQNIKSGPLAAFMDRAYGRELAIENLERDAIRASTNRLSFGRGKDFLHDINAATATEGEALEALRLLKSGKSLPEVKSNEYLYKVDIPDDQIAKMLDWDKPLSESLVKRVPGTKPSPEQQIIRSAVREGKTGSELYDDLMYFYKSNDTAYQDAIKQPLADRYNNPMFTGRGDAPYQAQASRYLKEQGIPGIKYLDQGSRQGGKGTSNFVLFDDQIPQILEINDKSIATGPLSKKKWYGGKDPTQLTENEFIKTHKTGTIPYGSYDKMDWWGTDIKTNPQLIKTIDTPQGKVEFRKSGKKNRYNKYIGDDPNREIARGDDGLALSLSDSEIKAKGYPVEDETITAFLNGEPIGYASNEFGAVGVFLNPKGPRRFHGDSIGTELLTEFMKENPHMKMGQMTHSGERTARKTHKKLTNMMRGGLFDDQIPLLAINDKPVRGILSGQ